MPSAQTPRFQIPSEFVEFFAWNLDGNAAHRGTNCNRVLGAGTVPGLLTMALCSKNLVELPEYKKVLCAKSMEIKWSRPVYRDQHVFVKAEYADKPHPRLENTTIRENDCEVYCVESNELVIKYRIVQLLDA